MQNNILLLLLLLLFQHIPCSVEYECYSFAITDRCRWHHLSTRYWYRIPSFMSLYDLSIWTMTRSFSRHCLEPPWWRHHMEAFFALLGLCKGNAPVTSRLSSQGIGNAELWYFTTVSLNKWLKKKQSSCWWFWDALTLMCDHCNARRKAVPMMITTPDVHKTDTMMKLFIHLYSPYICITQSLVYKKLQMPKRLPGGE